MSGYICKRQKRTMAKTEIGIVYCAGNIGASTKFAILFVELPAYITENFLDLTFQLQMYIQNGNGPELSISYFSSEVHTSTGVRSL